MSIIQLFLVGLAWIISAALIMTVTVIFFMVAWIQANERKEPDAQTEPAEEGSRYPAPRHRRRRAAGSYPCQVP